MPLPAMPMSPSAAPVTLWHVTRHTVTRRDNSPCHAPTTEPLLILDTILWYDEDETHSSSSILHFNFNILARCTKAEIKEVKYDKIWRHNWISFYLLKSAISRSNPQLLKYYFELTMTICIKFTLLCSSSLFTRLSCHYSRVPVTWSGCYSLLKKL